ncbi:MAG: glycerophosphodiester phosphodiesterase family protein [Candidatus Heimdallarchaeaceae archaeon]
MMRPLYWDFNKVLSDLLNLQTNYVLIIMLIFCVPLVYTGIFLVKYSFNLKNKDETKPKLVNKILSILSLVIGVALFVQLILTFGEDSVIITQTLQYYSLFIFIFITLGFLIFLYPLSTEFLRILQKPADPFLWPRMKKILSISSIILLYVWIIVMPLVFQPTYVLVGELPTKPQIIAHRGGAHFAPENTMEAGLFTQQINASGWEIDVQVSYDGIPFLMHDSTLKRTTNVSEEFPGREDEPASNFTMSELKQLNAGAWFVNEDPHGTIARGEIAQPMLDLYQIATIPTLEEALNFSRDENLIVDVDLKFALEESHPYYDQYFDTILDTLINASIDDQIWVTSYETEWLDQAMLSAPDMLTALTLDLADYITVEDFQATGYDMVNTHHGKTDKFFREFAEAGIPVNAWTVNIVSRFQQVWTLGVTSVTTDEPNVYIDIDKPSFLITRTNYIIIWLVVDVAGICGILALRFFRSKKK